MYQPSHNSQRPFPFATGSDPQLFPPQSQASQPSFQAVNTTQTVRLPVERRGLCNPAYHIAETMPPVLAPRLNADRFQQRIELCNQRLRQVQRWIRVTQWLVDGLPVLGSILLLAALFLAPEGSMDASMSRVDTSNVPADSASNIVGAVGLGMILIGFILIAWINGVLRGKAIEALRQVCQQFNWEDGDQIRWKFSRSMTRRFFNVDQGWWIDISYVGHASAPIPGMVMISNIFQ